MRWVEEIHKHNTVCMVPFSCKGQGNLCCYLGRQRKRSLCRRADAPQQFWVSVAAVNWLRKARVSS